MFGTKKAEKATIPPREQLLECAELLRVGSKTACELHDKARKLVPEKGVEFWSNNAPTEKKIVIGADRGGPWVVLCLGQHRQIVIESDAATPLRRALDLCFGPSPLAGDQKPHRV